MKNLDPNGKGFIEFEELLDAVKKLGFGLNVQ